MTALSSDWRVTAGELEASLYRQLGVPSGFLDKVSVANVEAGSDSLVSAIRDLKREIFELHREASRIGTLPAHYPKHVDLVMRVISALLPWYTRPLSNFGQRTARTVEATVHVLDEVLRKQDALAHELAQMKNPASSRLRGLPDENRVDRRF